ncbi:MAG: Na+/H+ antiporter [Bryobacteraceae bacterium]
MSDIGTVELVFLLLLLFIVVFGLLARKLRVPYPIVMVVGGLCLGFIPGIPNISLNPELIFLVVLPPLLYASAWTTNWRDFRYNFISIFFLAFGLVGFTVVCVALVAPSFLMGFDWRLGLVLGAVVAPTDAIAATSIARRVGLPQRVVDVLEGESLINDATGLLALQFAVAIMVSRTIPTVSTALLTMVWLIVGGVGIGLLGGWIVDYVERQVDHGPIEITLSILTPYAVYLAADKVHASGVLAVVACGLFLRRRSAQFFSPTVRIQVWAFWESFTFVLNGLVFVLIGLQLPYIRASIRGLSLPQLLLDGALFSALLIVLRLAWIYPGSTVAYFLRRRLAHQSEKRPKPREIFVLGWTGMRGVVSLAAAIALPTVLADGSPFPLRNLIVFLTFSVILVTLVLQGITLPPLIRRLGMVGVKGPNCEETEARRIAIEAAVSHLEDAKRRDNADSAKLYEDLVGHYRAQLAGLRQGSESGAEAADHDRHIELSREATRIERETIVRLRNDGRINDEVLRRLERELDLSETRFATAEE